MNNLFDILLNRPMSEVVMRGLLFATFAIHFLFVLFMLGTAILSVTYFIFAQFHPQKDSQRWDWVRQVHHTFIAHKSLAVVIGVAALLSIQVGFTVPFLSSTNLFGPYWLLIIGLLILSFLSLEALGIRWGTQRVLKLALGIFGLALLLTVGGIFVAVLVTMEHPDAWAEIVHNGYRLTSMLSIHWLFRYLHVLGAAVVFGAAFHYFFSKEEQAEKRKTLMRWMTGGVIYQVVLGILLYLSIGERPDLVTNIILLVGIGAALGVLILTLSEKSLKLTTTLPVLLLIIFPMLLARQALQDRAVLPFQAQIDQNEITYKQAIEPFNQPALQTYQTNLQVVYNQPDVIYPKSCSFCHGNQADGQGIEAARLIIQPEKIAQVHSTRTYLHSRITTGIPGTAMPYFTIYTRDRLEALLTYFNDQYNTFGMPDAIPVQVSEATYQQAQTIFTNQCFVCHGVDGRTNLTVVANFTPPPPDLTQYTLNAQYMFDVITNGYTGTLMPTWVNYPEDVRWGLVKVVRSFYAPVIE